MQHKRVPLLWAFAGGCLSGAVILALWQAEGERSQASTSALDARAMFLDYLSRLNSVSDGEDALESAGAHLQVAPRQSPVTAATDGASPNSTGPSLPSTRGATQAADAEPTTDDGSSVAVVLARLEADYRRKATVTEPSGDAAPSRRPSSEPAHPDATATLPQPAAAPPSAAEQTQRPPPVESTAGREALASRPAPSLPSDETQAEPRPVAPSKPEPDVVIASRDSVRGNVVYMGDVQQNIYVGDARQANAAHAQQLAALQQQLAMIQYIQLLTLASRFQPALPNAAVSRPTVPVTHRHVTAFPSSITNTDNPWGFDFPPTVLVR